MSDCQYCWSATRTWILYKNLKKAHNTITICNPMSILNMVLLSIILTVAHMKTLLHVSAGEETERAPNVKRQKQAQLCREGTLLKRGVFC